MKNNTIKNIALFILLSAILVLNLLSAAGQSLTYDEMGHYLYGIQISELNSNRFNHGEMPFSFFNVIPWKIIKLLRLDNIVLQLAELNGHATRGEEPFQFYVATLVGRISTILFSLLLAVYVFKWSKDLYGFVPGLFSLWLYAFEPNIIAHSSLTTADFYAACMTTISVYYFWRFISFGGWKMASVSACTLGFSQLAKCTCILLYPVFIVITFVKYAKQIFRTMILRNSKVLMGYSNSTFKFMVFFCVVSIMIINIGFLFNKTFTPFQKYEFRSPFIKQIQQKSTILNYLPIPFPYPYIEGLEWAKYNEEVGGNFGNIYLLEKLRTEKGKDFKGFREYFFYALLYKIPIATQLFILFSVLAYIVNRKRHNFMKDELFLLCPVLFFAIYFTFFFKAQIGIRHFIIILPLVYVFCGSLLKNWSTWNSKFKGICVALMIYLAISNLSYFPHYISYFNELVWDRKQAYKILADSNIDWGQSELYLKEYKKKNPFIYENPDRPISGKIVVFVNDLVGVYQPKKYRWLRENFEPVDHIAYSYLVYDIAPADLEKIKNKK